MRFLQKMWEDVKRGENIDVYLTILVSLILAGLNIFGITPSSVINSLSLAILALLAISLLGNRYRLDKIMNNSQIGIEQVLFKEFSDRAQQEIINRMEKATDLLLIGSDLYRTLQMHYHLLENRLTAGKNVRIILMSPIESACEIIAKRRYRPITPVHYKLQVTAALETLVNLKNETSGKLELRIIDFPIGHGGVYTDIGTSEGRIFIWNHRYKSKEVARPKLDLNVSDGYWFKFFCDEANTLWENSIEWKSE